MRHAFGLFFALLTALSLTPAHRSAGAIDYAPELRDPSSRPTCLRRAILASLRSFENLSDADLMVVMNLPTLKQIPNIVGFLAGAKNASAAQKARLWEHYAAYKIRTHGALSWNSISLRGAQGEYVFRGTINSAILVIDADGNVYSGVYAGHEGIDIWGLAPDSVWEVDYSFLKKVEPFPDEIFEPSP